MKLREVHRYELEYRLSSPSTWAYAGFLFLISLWIFLATGADGPGYANSPDRIAEGSAIVGTVGLLVMAALFDDAAARLRGMARCGGSRRRSVMPGRRIRRRAICTRS